MNDKGRILVVDDDDLTRESLRYRLEQDGFQVAVAPSGSVALTSAAQQHPDLVVLDIGLPDKDGLSVCRALQRDHHSLPVIFLTGRSSEVDKISGMALGDDYVTKPFSLNELEARIGMVLRRSRQSPPESTGSTYDLGGIRLDTASHQVSVSGQYVELSPKEFDLLRLLMSRPGEALSANEILSAVWGPEYTGAHELVYVHISWLRQKLCIDPHNPKLIHTVRGVGYRFMPEEA
jgi:DNA-binding response OmpR family regulator